MTEKVSVIIPVYNVEKYLEKCLESIINQTYKNLEIIVVNDGSTDSSLQIINEIAKKDNRIIIFSEVNKGLSAARNHGVLNCTGDYVLFVDSDDFIALSLVEKFVEVAHKSGADYICSESYNFIDGDDKNAYKAVNSLNNRNVDYALLEKGKALEGMFYQKPSITGAYLKLYSTELCRSICFPEGKYYEDFATTYRFIRKARRIAFIKGRYYAYRIRKNSIMTQKYNPHKLDCIWVSEQIEKDFCKAPSEEKMAAYCGIFRLNRIVYSQLPFLSPQCSTVMNFIKKYRYEVVRNSLASKYERIIAISSYLGAVFFRLVLFVFGVIRTGMYRFQRG